MQDRVQILMLSVILLLTAMSGALGIVLLGRPEAKAPLVLMVRPGHAPVEWQGWQLTPPAADQDCAQNGFDRCSDGQDDEGVIDDTDDDTPAQL